MNTVMKAKSEESRITQRYRLTVKIKLNGNESREPEGCQSPCNQRVTALFAFAFVLSGRSRARTGSYAEVGYKSNGILISEGSLLFWCATSASVEAVSAGVMERLVELRVVREDAVDKQA